MSLRIDPWLVFALLTGTALAQAPAVGTNIRAHGVSGRLPVAFVYISSYVNGQTGQIAAFSAAPDGRLSLVQSLPLQKAVWGLTANDRYVFTTDTNYIYSFSIESSGAVKQVASIDAVKFDKDGCGSVNSLFLDRSGTSLYDFDHDYDCNQNDAYQFFTVDHTTGALAYLGVTNTSNDWWYGSVSFIGNNHYGYGANCIGDEYWAIYGFGRGSRGKLNELGGYFRAPVPPPGDFYCPYRASADSTDHIAISAQAVNADFGNTGLPRLATYTSHGDGTLTTKSTYRNMPKTTNQSISDVEMSPSGKLLAVSGSAGLQVFHFNGGEPITHYTDLLVTDQIVQCSWDNHDHLYAISDQYSKVFVFTVTPTGYQEAPGSPYSVDNPQFLAIAK